MLLGQNETSSEVASAGLTAARDSVVEVGSDEGQVKGEDGEKGRKLHDYDDDVGEIVCSVGGFAG